MAQKKLSTASRKRVARIMEMVHRVQSDAYKITEPQIAELVRRDAIPFEPDGYPANSMPEHSSGGSHGDKTMATVLAREQHRTNELRRRLKHVERLALHADVAVSELVSTLAYEDEKVEREKGRQGSTPCAICLELPAQIGAWCRPCYDDWRNHGQPDRMIWEMYRRGDTVKVDHDDVLRVPDCPPPGDGCTARRGPYAEKKPTSDQS
jgi:hypothetical protein